MKSLILLAAVAAALPSHLKIECNGYDPVTNDHVESEGDIKGAIGHFDGDQFRVSKTKDYVILTGSQTQVVINRATHKYVVYRWHGGRGAPIEWSRKEPGDGCYLSN